MLRLWKELDPQKFCKEQERFLLMEPVAKELHEELAEVDVHFTKSLWLPPIIAQQLGCWLCPSFSIVKEDVEYALNDFELPTHSATSQAEFTFC